MSSGPGPGPDSRAGPVRPPPQAARLFVALDLPEHVRAALAAWARTALGSGSASGEVRIVPERSLHVTLCFLGARPVGEISAIAAAVGGVRPAGAIALAPDGAVWLGGGGRARARVCAVALRDVSGTLGGIGALQAALARRLVDGGWYAPERRPFAPHVTVARRGRDAPGRPPALAGPAELGRFAASAVTLYRSWTEPGGARYEPLARHPLLDSE